MTTIKYNSDHVKEALEFLKKSKDSIYFVNDKIKEGINKIESANGSKLLLTDFSTILNYQTRCDDLISEIMSSIESKIKDIEEYNNGDTNSESNIQTANASKISSFTNKNSTTANFSGGNTNKSENIKVIRIDKTNQNTNNERQVIRIDKTHQNDEVNNQTQPHDGIIKEEKVPNDGIVHDSSKQKSSAPVTPKQEPIPTPAPVEPAPVIFESYTKQLLVKPL